MRGLARRPCRIDDRWKLNGLRTVILENERLRVSVLIELGARVHELIDKKTNRDWLYHAPRVQLRRPVYGGNYDDWWTGGMDEIAPTGWPCEIDGRRYPLLGELWSQPWSYQITEDSPELVEVRLWCEAVVAPLRVERWMSLRQGESTLHMRHRLVNLDSEPFNLLWGLHPAFALEHSNYRLDVPGTSAIVDPGSPDFPGEIHARYEWPLFTDRDGNQRDMRFPAPTESNSWCLHYVLVDEGWMALVDTETNEGIGMAFDHDVLNVIDLWGAYGGWRRGVYCISPEPWAGWPSNLAAATEQGTILTLERLQALNTWSAMTLFSNKGKPVVSIEADGRVI